MRQGWDGGDPSCCHSYPCLRFAEGNHSRMIILSLRCCGIEIVRHNVRHIYLLHNKYIKTKKKRIFIEMNNFMLSIPAFSSGFSKQVLLTAYDILKSWFLMVFGTNTNVLF